VTPWAVVAATYGVVLAVAAVTQPISRRSIALAASLAYSLVAVGTGTLGSVLWVQLLIPGALLLAGYWLSGMFFRDPQPWLERWLLSIDRAIAADRWGSNMPALLAALLEVCYMSVYLVIGGAAIYTATFGPERVGEYWDLVLAAALASYAPLPWLRSRPPRVVDRHYCDLTGTGPVKPPHLRTLTAQPMRTDGDRPRKVAESAPHGLIRRLNMRILENASIQANTLPSGHVSAAVAAALAVMSVDPVTGWGGMVMAGLITVAAVAGRYHYAVDCVAGVAVASALWSLM
jgi:hypothetical protein